MKKNTKRIVGLIVLLIIILVFLVFGFFYSNTSDGTLFEKIKNSLLLKKSPNELTILSYNVFLRPKVIGFSDYMDERSELIGEWIGKSEVDVVTLQEAWNTPAVSTIIEELKSKFPYFLIDQPPKKSGAATSGGLMILSRWPIEEKRTLVYNNCTGTDCLATKGAVHFRIKISKKAEINLVTTHLNSGYTNEDREIRNSQLIQLKKFIEEIEGKKTGPIIITGDFNINSLDGTGEYKKLLETLNVEDYNVSDEITVNCGLEESLYCDNPKINERLDYIFTLVGEENLIRKETKHLPMETKKINEEVKYLSDHRAILTSFEIKLK